MSKRFECVRNGIHWGVRDNKNPNAQAGAVLDLVPHGAGVRVRWRPSTNDWVPSSLVASPSEESKVAKRWKYFVDEINESAIARRKANCGTGGNEDLYHDFGDKYSADGAPGSLNCECLVTLILTGQATPVLGKLVSALGIPPELLMKVGNSSTS